MQKRSEETRNRILDTANNLFSKNGFDLTSVDEICQAAGVSKGAFYHHYPSKQAVFMDTMESWLAGLNQSMNLTRQETLDVPSAIIQMAEMAGGVFQAADVRISIFPEIWVQAYRDPQIWQEVIAPYRQYQRYFSQMIQEGIAQGSLRPIDADHASRTLVALAMGLLMQALFDPQGADWQAETRQTITLLLEGMIRREA